MSKCVRSSVLVTALVLLFCGVACGTGGQGDKCDTEGHVKGECDDGLICGKQNDKSNDLVCLKQCQTQADCPAGSDCNGVGNTSIKGCRAK